MKRRRFIANSMGIAAGAAVSKSFGYGFNLIDIKPSKYKHRLPKTDVNYIHTKPYIEDTPVKEYSWASDDAYEAFQDIKYGVRLHWGLYSIWQLQKESWPFLGQNTPKFDFAKRQEYQQLYKTFNPDGFDSDQWMEMFREWGMKMFAFTTKHHEGFSMFDTKTRVRKRVNWTSPSGPVTEDCNLAYSVMDSPFKRDIVGELCSSAHKYGIKVDLYFSHIDWYDADFRPYGYHPLQIPSGSDYLKAKWKEVDPDNEEFNRTKSRFGDLSTVVPDPSPEEVNRMIERHRAQLKELLSNYGKIDMICLDMYFGPKVWPQIRQTMVELRKIQPDVMFRSRGIGNYGDYYTPEGFVPGGKENTDVPWFVIYPLGKTFSYEPVAGNYKGESWVIRSLIDSVAKGGNFMVGIGPDANGRFEPTAIKQLTEVGKWLKLNGEGIYATRARDGELWKEGDNIRFTRSKNKKRIYAFCYEWPGEKLILNSVKAVKGSGVFLMGSEIPLDWKESGEGIEIDLRGNQRKGLSFDGGYGYGFKIEVV
jgi:alpha-L-fucosidase